MSTRSMIERLESRLRGHREDWEGWLVYADYLTDQGDERGQLIRLEHRLADIHLPQEERDALWVRARALQEAHQEQWLAGWSVPEGVQLRWHRGFVLGISVYRDDPIDVIEALVAHPAGHLLDSVTIQPRTPALGDEGAQALARSDALRGLRELFMEGCQIGDDGVIALAGSQPLSALRALDLAYNRVGDEGVAVLSEVPWPLEELCLANNVVGDAGAAALARTPASPAAWSALQRLWLNNNRVGDVGAAALARSQRLSSLSVLYLDGNAIGDEGKRALAQAEHLRGCRVMM